MWLALYPDELNELYRRQAEWTIKYADACIEAGVDMVHFSDDWGAQKDLMFNPDTWRELIYPHMKKAVDHVHSRGRFASLHSDGCIAKVTDGIAEIGFDVVHPWQESAGMSYDLYLEKYSDMFAILGGICVQSTLGLVGRDRLESEIRRVFSTLGGKRWDKDKAEARQGLEPPGKLHIGQIVIPCQLSKVHLLMQTSFDLRHGILDQLIRMSCADGLSGIFQAELIDNIRK